MANERKPASVSIPSDAFVGAGSGFPFCLSKIPTALQELSKYLLTSYIRKMTGRFHDRSASVLIQELVGPTNYDEVAQRMWRARNYKRIDKHCSWMTRFLVATSVVVAQTP
jgi:hypothetical protein